MLAKAMEDIKCQDHRTWMALVDTTTVMKNRLASRGGFSPVQRVLGYLPQLPGKLLSERHEDREMDEECPGMGSTAAERLHHGPDGVLLQDRPFQNWKDSTSEMVWTRSRHHHRLPLYDLAELSGGATKASPERIWHASEEERMTVSGWLDEAHGGVQGATTARISTGQDEHEGRQRLMRPRSQ